MKNDGFFFFLINQTPQRYFIIFFFRTTLKSIDRQMTWIALGYYYDTRVPFVRQNK